jgi:hypothetical protein
MFAAGEIIVFKFSDVKTVFDEFWSGGDMAASNTSMYGLADIWEGPSRSGGTGVITGTNTALAIDTYKDNVYVLYGGGIKSWLKVVTPDSSRIYDIGATLILMTNNNRPPYFSMAVINENEVIAGYLYLNLEHQFHAPFGVDLASVYKNPSFNISNARTSSSAWVTAIRDIGGWHVYVSSKASPDDCLPCAKKKQFAKVDFECSDIPYSRDALVMPGYESGALAYTDHGYGPRIKKPVMSVGKCAAAINKYSAVFNHVKVSPEDVGLAGRDISRYCNSAMYYNMVNVSEYNAGAKEMRKKYLEKLLDGENDKGYIISESRKLAGIIGGYIDAISSSLGDNDFTKSIFRNTEWWAPIWFNANQSKVNSLDDKFSCYKLLYSVDLKKEFIPMLLQMASSPGSSGRDTFKGPMGWILVGKAGKSVSKFGKNNMTYFRFPYSSCISTRKLFTIPSPLELDGICGVETRANGILVWGWRYHINSTLNAYFYSNDGAFSKLGSINCGSSFAPTSGAPMAVSDGGSEWIVKDYFYTGSSIDYVETSVKKGSEMEALMGTSMVLNAANINEYRGSMAGTDGAYQDGTLDAHPGRYDLDDSSVHTDRQWGQGRERFDWVSGYSGFMIMTADRL